MKEMFLFPSSRKRGQSMRKTLIAMAMALSIAGAPSCSTVHQYLETQEQQVKEDALEDIVRSVVCVRNRTTYVSPKGDQRETVQVHGTGFAYKRENGWTYLATNDHVGHLPDKQVVFQFFNPKANGIWLKEKEVLTLVDNYADQNEDDDVSVSVVRSDEEIDTMVLRTKKPLHVAHSYRIRSAPTHVGDQAYVVGLPLAATKAVTEGIIANPNFAHDEIQYLLLDITIQPGNSGSPVFQRESNGEFYLIGQIRKCMPYTGMCGGFGMATNISELQETWRINTNEPLLLPDWLIEPPKEKEAQQARRNIAL